MMIRNAIGALIGVFLVGAFFTTASAENTLYLTEPGQLSSAVTSGKNCGAYTAAQGLDLGDNGDIAFELSSSSSECLTGAEVVVGETGDGFVSLIGGPHFSAEEGQATNFTGSLVDSLESTLQRNDLFVMSLLSDRTGPSLNLPITLDSTNNTVVIAAASLDYGVVSADSTDRFLYVVKDVLADGSEEYSIVEASITVNDNGEGSTTPPTPVTGCGGTDVVCIVETNAWNAASPDEAVSAVLGMWTRNSYKAWATFRSSSQVHAWRFVPEQGSAMAFGALVENQDQNLGVAISTYGGDANTIVSGCTATGLVATVNWKTPSSTSYAKCVLNPDTMYYANVWYTNQAGATPGMYHWNNYPL